MLCFRNQKKRPNFIHELSASEFKSINWQLTGDHQYHKLTRGSQRAVQDTRLKEINHKQPRYNNFLPVSHIQQNKYAIRKCLLCSPCLCTPPIPPVTKIGMPTWIWKELNLFRVVGTNMEMISDQAKINKTGIMILEKIFSAPCKQRT